VTSTSSPRHAGWTVLAGVAGAVVLAFVGAPQSLDQVFLVGLDTQDVIGAQFAVAVCGAFATAAALLLARHWRWLLVAGSVGVLVAFLFHNPDPIGFTVEAAAPGQDSASPGLPVPTVWAAGVVAAAGLLLVGLFGAARELRRSSPQRAGLVGLVGAAAYFGVSVIGGVRGAGQVVRLVVLAVAVGAVVFAVVRNRRAVGVPTAAVRQLRLVAAGVVVFSVLSTALVGISGETVYGTVVGGVAGLVLLALALAVAARAGVAGVLAVGAIGLVLAAPVFILLFLYDTMTGQLWYGWPIALAGVLLGGVAAGRRWLAPAVVAAAALPFFALVTQFSDVDLLSGQLIVWVLLALTMAAVTATVGTAAGSFADLPALGALGTVAALGVHGTLNFARIGADGTMDIAKVTGTAAQVISGVLLICAAVLLVVLRRFAKSR
jgi:hypothetical protein